MRFWDFPYFKHIISTRERHIPMKANSIFHAIRHGILICNTQGRIVFFNRVYGEFIGRTLQEVRNRPVTDIRPGSHVPEVLKLRRPIENILRNENGQEYFASIYPLVENDILQGTISLASLYNKLKNE